MKTVNFTNKSIMSWLAMAMLCMFAVGANAQVCSQGSNLTLPADDCEAVVQATDLAGANAGLFTKVVMIQKGPHYTGPLVKPLNPDAVGYAPKASVMVSAPGTYKYEVDGGAGCWGTFNVEDKTAPKCIVPNGIPDLVSDHAPFLKLGSPADDLRPEIVSCTADEATIARYFDILEADDFMDCSDLKDRDVYSIDRKKDICAPGGLTSVEADLARQAIANLPQSQQNIIRSQGYEICGYRTKTWYISDWSGRLSENTCTQYVFIIRPTKVTIDMSVTAECGSTPATGAPYLLDLNGRKIFLEAGKKVCKFAASYHEDPIIYTCTDKCPDNKRTYKQARHWTVIDWCSGTKADGTIIMADNTELTDQPLDEVTVITSVSDKTAPVFTTAPVITQWANPYDCDIEVKIAPITATDACQGAVPATIRVEVRTTDIHGGNNYGGTFNVYQAEAGQGVTFKAPLGAIYIISASAWDCCGNYSAPKTWDGTVDFKENYAPICIANDELNVSLVQTDPHGSTVHTVGTRVYPEDIDDTSRDNCAIDFMKIRKISDAGVAGPWVDFIEYHYDTKDLKDKASCTIIKWVDLQVTDINGNVSVCPSKLVLRDETRPAIEAAEDFFIDCLWESHYDFNAPQLWGSCYTIDSTTVVKPYHCPTQLFKETWVKDGLDRAVRRKMPAGVTAVKTRTWTASKMTEHGMVTVRDSQRIFVTEVIDETFVFPYDVKLECTSEGIPAPAKLSEILTNRGCSEWVMNVSEKTFLGAEDACYKIIRNYEFINWCRWDENLTDDNRQIDKFCADRNDDGKLLAADLDYQIAISIGGKNDIILEAEQFQIVKCELDRTGLGYHNSKDRRMVRRGYFNYTQVIKVTDSVDPTLTSSVKVVCNPANDCATPGDVKVTLNPADGCSSATVTGYKIDLGRTGVKVADIYGTLSADGKTISGKYPTGKHTFHVRVDDQCGNFVWFAIDFEVGKECKKPTPIAYGTFTAVMENCTVDIWLSDIEASSSDNCALDSLAIELVTDKNSDGIIDGADVNRAYFEAPGAIYKGHDVVTVTSVGKNIVALWARDVAGNTQFAFAPVYANDNLGTCGGADAVATSVIGSIVNENDEDIDQVTISAKGTGMIDFTSIFNGSFNVTAVPMHSDVSISAEKNVGHLNGVSTADLVLLQRHVLGISNLNSAYKIIAADANNDTKVDTRDMLHISRLILGIYSELPNNNSWRFVSKAHTFANPTSPWGFAEAVDFQNMEADVQADFIGIKIGDLTGNAVPSQLLGSDDTKVGAMTIAIDEATIAAGETRTIEFTTSDFNNFAGYQFSIALDSRVAFNGVSAGSLEGVSDANFGLAALESGVITTNWSNVAGVSVENGTVMFSLTVTASETVKVSEILAVNSSVTTAEAYNSDLDVHSVGVQFIRAANAAFELFQNTPNPVSGETVIGFNLPTAGAATLKVMDVAGRTLSTVSNDFAAGYNTITLNKSDLGTTGVLYYQLDTENNSATKKMVILE